VRDEKLNVVIQRFHLWLPSMRIVDAQQTTEPFADRNGSL
jgi:hypothetical protein